MSGGGVFWVWNDEGQIDGPLYSRAEAEDVFAILYSAEDGEYVAEACHDHPEQEHESCECCNEETES